MALNTDSWTNSLFAKMSAKGFNGAEKQTLCNAVGAGSVLHLVGKSFDTSDEGSITGTGSGAGVGVSGLVASSISARVFAKCVTAFGGSGSMLQLLCDAIGETCEEQMMLATLTSSHTPIFLGDAEIDVGSIAVVGSQWGSLIEANGTTFLGDKWPDFANAIGEGCAEEVLASGTGDLSISGTNTVPPPVPGQSGTGSGAIS